MWKDDGYRCRGVTSHPQTLVAVRGHSIRPVPCGPGRLLVCPAGALGPADFLCSRRVKSWGPSERGLGETEGWGQEARGGADHRCRVCTRARARAGGSNGDQPPPGSPWPGQSSAC